MFDIRVLVVKLSISFLACCAIACQPESTCTADNHCVDDDGEPRCEDGYEWRDEDNPDDLTCIAESTTSTTAENSATPEPTPIDEGSCETDECLAALLPCELGDVVEPLTLFDLASLGKHAVELINEERAYFVDESHDAAPIVWSDTLWASSTCHAYDMCERDFFAHQNPDGLWAKERIQAASGLVFGDGFTSYAENIAWAYYPNITQHSSLGTLELVQRDHHIGYMDECICYDDCPSGKQAGHRANILSPAMEAAGVGVWFCERDGSFYQGQNFWRTSRYNSAHHAYCPDGTSADPPDPFTVVE